MRYDPGLNWCRDVKFKLQRASFYYHELPFELRDMSRLRKAMQNGYVEKQKGKPVKYKINTRRL